MRECGFVGRSVTIWFCHHKIQFNEIDSVMHAITERIKYLNSVTNDLVHVSWLFSFPLFILLIGHVGLWFFFLFCKKSSDRCLKLRISSIFGSQSILLFSHLDFFDDTLTSCVRVWKRFQILKWRLMFDDFFQILCNGK